MVFIPIAILTGYWMYMGASYAIIVAASWVGLHYFVGGNNGFGIALLVQILIFAGRFVWKTTRKPAVAAVA